VLVFLDVDLRLRILWPGIKLDPPDEDPRIKTHDGRIVGALDNTSGLFQATKDAIEPDDLVVGTRVLEALKGLFDLLVGLVKAAGPEVEARRNLAGSPIGDVIKEKSEIARLNC
jgi:hypothetical protein